MKQFLSIPLLLAVFALPASSSTLTDGADPVGIALEITDLPGTAGTAVVISITDDGPEPIPPLSGYSVVSIEDSPEPFPLQGVSLEHNGTSVVVSALLDDDAVDGVLFVVLGFDEIGPVGITIDLASITGGADPD